MSGPSGKPLNYDVEFVDATTGDWLQGTEGYDAGLPQLRSRG